jgi:Domain of unknown function (DUF4129)
VVLAASLLALIAAGLRGAVPAPALDGPFRHHVLIFGAVLEGVLACLLLALGIRHLRAPRDGGLAARLRKLLTYVLVVALVAIPVAYLPLNDVKLKPRPPQTRPTSSQPLRLPQTPKGGPPAAVLIVVIILGALALAALVYLIAKFGRIPRIGGRRRRSQAVGVPEEPAAEDDEADLREAVESGRSALLQPDDTRAAIIACYVAMEQSLARAGAVRAATDTPDELLARAAGQGLVSGGSAGRLTTLFYEARFSSHPMPPASRDDARRALSELAASLGGSEPASVSEATR